MKVLFLNPIGTMGGAEEVLVDLIASLRDVDRNLELEVVALADGPLLAEAAAHGAQTDVIELPGSLAALGESGGLAGLSRGPIAGAALLGWLPRFRSALRSKQPGIIHSNGLKTHLLAALAAPDLVPVVWHLHDFLSERLLTSKLLALLQRRAAAAIGVSDSVSRDARGLLRRVRVQTILNGVRTERFEPGRASPVNLDELAGLSAAPVGTIRVGLVATYASWKGHLLFLDAACRANAPGVRFYIVGGPVYSTPGSQVTEAVLRAEIARLGLQERCGLVGFQREIARVYAALDVVVNASTRPEPFGRTIAEAMASGRAVVGAAAGGVLEQIEPSVNGLIFPPGDAQALSEQLTLLVTNLDLRTRLQQRALERARRDLNAERLGPAVSELYGALRVPAPARLTSR